MLTISWSEVLSGIDACRACGLCAGATHKVPGQGDPHAALMLIGEGPGADEDATGLAFVGAAGKLLTRMLAAIGLERERVYICNIVKCRPPSNRAPEDGEAAACLPFLRAQFALVRPRVVLLLGATAAKHVLGPDVRVTRDRGRFFERKGTLFLITYHPAALLRDESKKGDAWRDMKAVRLKLDELATARPPEE